LLVAALRRACGRLLRFSPQRWPRSQRAPGSHLCRPTGGRDCNGLGGGLFDGLGLRDGAPSGQTLCAHPKPGVSPAQRPQSGRLPALFGTARPPAHLRVCGHCGLAWLAVGVAHGCLACVTGSMYRTMNLGSGAPG
jgi:hypothetical protein